MRRELLPSKPVGFATSLKEGGFGNAEKFFSSPEAPSPRELANPQGLTEGVISFTFVLAFPVYRISAKGARVENPHETKG